MTNKQLMGRLARAQHACSDCGKLYAKPLKWRVSTWYEGKCDICMKRKTVTEARDFGYFTTFALQLKRTMDKEKRVVVRTKKKQSPPKLWIAASTAMQEYYRSLGRKCMICSRPQTVMHHWQAWGRSTHLRFNEKNLVPLCKECHCKFHAGDIQAHYDIRVAMTAYWGASWEVEIMTLSHKEFKLSAPELRDYLNDKIEYYNNLKNG